VAVVDKDRKAESRTEVKAWLFQFRPGEEPRQNVKSGIPVAWKASRWYSEMGGNDVVFYWESGASGGLRGWGAIESGQTFPDKVGDPSEHWVSVVEHSWLTSPIPRKTVFESGAIAPDNLLRINAQATNFRLNPQEARRLADLLPSGPRPAVENVVANPNDIRSQPKTKTASSVPSSRNWTRSLLARLGANEASGSAGQLLDATAKMIPPKGGTITTTRLLLGMVELGSSFEPLSWNRGSSEDQVGLVILARVLNAAPLGSVFAAISAEYLGDTPRNENPPTSVRESKNIANILKRALTIGTDLFDAKSALFANGLIAALLTHGGTSIEKRFQNLGVSLRDLQIAFIRQLASVVPADVERWRQALNVDFEVEPVPPLEIRKIGIAGLGNDDPWREDLDDKLGVADEARAFARVAAAKFFEPPLAFGIFGDWGSGKSFFMRLIHDHIEKLRTGQAPEADRARFHEGIVQVRFNAWHYVEQNLWASLVDHIFSELDRWIKARLEPKQPNPVFERLATARELTIDSAEVLVGRRREQKVAAERLANAERALSIARDETGATPLLVWKAIQQTFEQNIQKDDLKEIAATLGLDQIATDSRELKRTLDGLSVEGKRAKTVVRGLLRQLRSPWTVAALLFALVLLPPLLLAAREWFAASIVYPSVSQFIHGINETALGAAGLLATAATVIGLITDRVKSAVAKLESYRVQLDKAINAQLTNPTDSVKQAEGQFAALTAKAEEARAMLAETSSQLAEAAREYASGTGRGRLLRFVRERASDGQYAKHLGLVATVRKDFAELSSLIKNVDPQVQAEAKKQLQAYQKRVEALLANAATDKLLAKDEIEKLEKSAEATEVPAVAAFQRIVLYIDDLDRCPPDKVVDVLQAVHLLLTFPLFVVIVAVDARWVSRALERHYSTLLDAREAAAGEQRSATAHDYLEKIFQVPYWVRPMDGISSRNFLADRAEASDESMRADEVGSSGEDDPIGSSRELDPSSEISASPLGVPEDDVPEKPQPPGPDEDRPLGNQPKPERFATHALTLTPAEAQFMARLAPHVGSSPRRALRFLNTYRVIKAGLGPEELTKLEEKGGYRGLMSQIAVATGSPSLLNPWITLLSNADARNNLSSLRSRLEEHDWFTTSQARGFLCGTIDAFYSRPEVGQDLTGGGEVPETIEAMLDDGVETLNHYAPLARRYSFGG
jgi:hypothetical protein